MTMPPATQSTEAEIEALDRLCQRLSGFEAGITLEWLDGAMAALLAGPRTVLPGEWMPLLLGDAWQRAIADPEDLAASMDTLMRRWNILALQLLPERLFGDPDQLHFVPLIDDFDPAQRDAMLAEGQLTAEEAADWPLTGEGWPSASWKSSTAWPMTGRRRARAMPGSSCGPACAASKRWPSATRPG